MIFFSANNYFLLNKLLFSADITLLSRELSYSADFTFLFREIIRLLQRNLFITKTFSADNIVFYY